jgi:hypothetical protein
MAVLSDILSHTASAELYDQTLDDAYRVCSTQSSRSIEAMPDDAFPPVAAQTARAPAAAAVRAPAAPARPHGRHTVVRAANEVVQVAEAKTEVLHVAEDTLKGANNKLAEAQSSARVNATPPCAQQCFLQAPAEGAFQTRSVQQTMHNLVSTSLRLCIALALSLFGCVLLLEPSLGRMKLRCMPFLMLMLLHERTTFVTAVEAEHVHGNQSADARASESVLPAPLDGELAPARVEAKYVHGRDEYKYAALRRDTYAATRPPSAPMVVEPTPVRATLADVSDPLPLQNASMVDHTHIARRLAVRTVQPGMDTLQTALDNANAGDELVLADGTYTGNSTNALVISKTITIRAFNEGQAILDGENARRVVYIGAGSVVQLRGLRITRGRSDQHGGGIYSLSTLTITNCHVNGNAITNANGGGIYSGGSLTMTNCNVNGNIAGVYNRYWVSTTPFTYHKHGYCAC